MFREDVQTGKEEPAGEGEKEQLVAGNKRVCITVAERRAGSLHTVIAALSTVTLKVVL